MKRKQYAVPFAEVIALGNEGICLTITSNPAAHNINNIDMQGGNDDGGGDNWDNLAKGNGIANGPFDVWEEDDVWGF